MCFILCFAYATYNFIILQNYYIKQHIQIIYKNIKILILKKAESIFYVIYIHCIFTIYFSKQLNPYYDN